MSATVVRSMIDVSIASVTPPSPFLPRRISDNACSTFGMNYGHSETRTSRIRLFTEAALPTALVWQRGVTPIDCCSNTRLCMCVCTTDRPANLRRARETMPIYPGIRTVLVDRCHFICFGRAEKSGRIFRLP